jgi:amidase
MTIRQTRRGFLETTLAAAGLSTGSMASGQERAGATRRAPEFELDELGVFDLQEGMEIGGLTARRIAELYLERIEAVDRSGPELRSILDVNPDALEIASSLDAERRERGPRGPLHGVPVLLKDNLDTADRMTTTAGSLALEGSIPSRDSFVAERLRAAGAVLLAKTNLSEWANFRSTRSSSGWSARGGQCKNPYVLDRNPCGSSSGSGAATSAGLGAVSIGTETDGSIVCPSNACGLVGLKPTLGLVSRSGIIPVAHSQDTAGPMTRTVVDAAAVLSAIAGPDPRDPATGASAEHIVGDYVRFLDPNGLRGRRVGIARRYFGFHPGVDRCMEEAIDAMRRSGAEIVDPVELPSNDELLQAELLVLLYEFKADLNLYLGGLPESARVRTLADVIAFNEENRDREMPYFGQELFLQAESKGPLSEKEYVDALALCRRMARDEGLDTAVSTHRLDAIAGPTGGPAWVTDLVNGDHYSGGSSSLAAMAGYPNITVPSGWVHGLPVGISFFGPAWSEPTLLGVAYAFEKETRFRRKPEFLESVPGG